MDSLQSVLVLLLLPIFGTAVFIRLYHLGQILFGTWYDEADDGLNALHILDQA